MQKLKYQNIIKLFLLFFLLNAVPSFSQTKWFKYEGNPVLDVGPSGSWYDAAVLISRVIYKDSVYNAWHNSSDGTSRYIGYVSSPDGIHWSSKQKISGLELGPDGTWDQREATAPYIVFDGSDYHMWYQGYDGVRLQIGYARSLDGLNWKKAKYLNPVLTSGPSDWDGRSVSFPSVIVSDKHDVLGMWYSGYRNISEYHIQIGFAAAKEPYLWKKHSDPVLTTGIPGSWDDRTLLMHRVIHNEGNYEMWYAGSRGIYSTAQIGYATSPDGIKWIKHEKNPVLTPGTAGSWEDKAVFVGDVLLEGSIYKMWYGGSDGSIDRCGYAISPKGTVVKISADNMYVIPEQDTVFVTVRVDDPKGINFSAEIKSQNGDLIEILNLYDDGAHADSFSGDGIFTNYFRPAKEQIYSVDLKLKLEGNDKGFELNNAGSFTTVGPIVLDKIIFVKNSSPTPGDTVEIKLNLRNKGSSVQADSVSVKISTLENWIINLTEESPVYGTIVSGGTAAANGSYRFLISPNCPENIDIKFDIRILSSGISLWYDSFFLTTRPPWYRSYWAYGFYTVIILSLFYGIRRIENRRLRLKHEREMDRFQMDKLKEIDQLKSRFFANISHEFRTPLTLIEAPLKEMMSDKCEGNMYEQFEMMLRNTRRLHRLVDQLLDLSKVESGQMKLRICKIDIVELIKSIAASFESIAGRKEIKFTTTGFDNKITGWVDKDALEKIIVNLLSNAFKFTNSGGEISLSIFPADNNDIIIIINDTGIGIPRDKLDKIFDRFYQVDDAHTREYEGSGIGLALTKELVELHKGVITVESKIEKGSVFSIKLPLHKERFKEVEIIETSLMEKSGESYINDEWVTDSTIENILTDKTLPIILIIEDNADMRKYIHNSLNHEFQIIEAVNGDSGLEKAIEEIPDLIISDVMMPRMDGFQLCSKLKTDERTSHIPVILLTAKAGQENKLGGLETGADDYLTKPFDTTELRVRIKNLVSQRRMLREKFRKEGIFNLYEISVTSADTEFINRLVEVVKLHIADQAFTAEIFAEKMCLSRMQLHRKTKALTDLSAWQFVRKVRMHHAAELIQKKAGNVSEIAWQVGYESPSKFSQAFKEEFGKNPSDYYSANY